MPTTSQIEAARCADGKLPAHTGVGMYPLFYITRDNESLCAKCANRDEVRDPDYADDPRWNLIACEVNWEDPRLICEECNERVESAYAEEEVKRAAGYGPRVQG